MGRNWLGYSLVDLWKLTPREFKSQLDVHQDIQSQMYGHGDKKSMKTSATKGYIDQIPGW